jgi:hypothetical protein
VGAAVVAGASDAVVAVAEADFFELLPHAAAERASSTDAAAMAGAYARARRPSLSRIKTPVSAVRRSNCATRSIPTAAPPFSALTGVRIRRLILLWGFSHGSRGSWGSSIAA